MRGTPLSKGFGPFGGAIRKHLQWKGFGRQSVALYPIAGPMWSLRWPETRWRKNLLSLGYGHCLRR